MTCIPMRRAPCPSFDGQASMTGTQNRLWSILVEMTRACTAPETTLSVAAEEQYCGERLSCSVSLTPTLLRDFARVQTRPDTAPIGKLMQSVQLDGYATGTHADYSGAWSGLRRGDGCGEERG